MGTPDGLVAGPVLGGLDVDRVRVWFRARGPSAWQLQVFPLEDPENPVWTSPWQQVDDATGFTGMFRVMGLQADTAYGYHLLEQSRGLQAQGCFRTAPRLGTRRSFTLALAGSFLPASPEPSVPPETLRARPGEPRLLVLPGHWVLADAVPHNGLKALPQDGRDYRLLYQRALEHPGWQQTLACTPVLSMWGHRSVDWGWAWADVDRTEGWLPPRVRWWRRLQGRPPQERRLPRYRIVTALQTYWEHLGQLNPPLLAPPVGAEDLGRPLVLTADRGHFGYTFAYGAVALLALDVHMHRVAGGWSRWLHPEQWRTLEGWLASVQEAYPLKLVVSPAAVFARGAGDFWDGHRNALRRLLHILVARQVHGVVFLSHGLEWGWLVEACLEAEGRQVRVWEIGVGAMSLPAYPKALWRPRGWTRLPLVTALDLRVPYVPPPHVVEIHVQWEPEPRLAVRFHDGRRTLAQHDLHLEVEGRP